MPLSNTTVVEYQAMPLKSSLKKMVVSAVNVRHCPLGFFDEFISFGF